MKVKNLILYQVSTDRNYQVGDVVIFDKDKPNGQYNKVFNTDFRFKEIRPCDKMYSSAKFKKFKSNEEIYSIARILERYDFSLREIALEEVRSDKFPHLPSRLHCMFLSPNKDIALKNIETMAKNKDKQGKLLQVVAVKLDGYIFKAGKIVVDREAKSYNYYKEQAYAYWGQEVFNDEDIKEILFEGRAEIVDILKVVNT